MKKRKKLKKLFYVLFFGGLIILVFLGLFILYKLLINWHPVEHQPQKKPQEELKKKPQEEIKKPNKKPQKKKGITGKGYKVLMTAGILTMFIAGAMEAYLLVDDYMAGYHARLVLEQMKVLPSLVPVSAGTETGLYVDEIINSIDNSGIGLSSGSHLDREPEVTAAAIDPDSDYIEPADVIETIDQTEQFGYTELANDTVGILSIPRLGLELPILGECNNKLLKISICKYMGDVQDKPQRLIIAGHNYRHHFGKLSSLSIGDKVSYTSLEGKEYWYAVSEITDISMYDFTTLLGGEWDISLFTCNSDGKWRVLVRCIEIKED